MSSALGGFWCARILLNTPSRQIMFTWFSLILLTVILLLGILGHILSGDVHYLLDSNEHPVVSRIMILSFAPLTFVLRGRRPMKTVGVLLLCLSYAGLFISTLRSAVLMPLALGVIAFFVGILRLKYLLAIVISLFMIIPCFLHFYPKRAFKLKDYEPAYYRIESYPFSWHIARKHPFLGIGLRAPRDRYLKDYELRYPYVTRERFIRSLDRLVTSENLFLTLMVDQGFPFLIIYFCSILILYLRLLSMVRRSNSSPLLPPRALFIPITAGLLHFLVFDGLYHPQTGWFFHILLGLISVRLERNLKGPGEYPPPEQPIKTMENNEKILC